MPVVVDVVSASSLMPGLLSETEASDTTAKTSVVRSEWVSMGVLQVCTYQETLDVSFRCQWAAKKKVDSRKKWHRSPQAVWAINI